MITHHPFLLDAHTPEQGENVREMLMAKYGRPPEPMWDRLEAEAQSSGLVLDMRKQTMRYPSQAALGLIVEAGRRGLDQHAIERSIAHAHYLDADNISDPDTLERIAVEHGFGKGEGRKIATDPQLKVAVEQAAMSAAQQGINGVPFFVFEQKYAMSGAQPVAAFIDVFNQLQTGAEPGEV